MSTENSPVFNPYTISLIVVIAVLAVAVAFKETESIDND